MREAMWLQMFEAAAQAGRSLIFTFAPEGTVSAGFPDETMSAVAVHGGRVRFIALTISQAPAEQIAERIAAHLQA